MNTNLDVGIIKIKLIIYIINIEQLLCGHLLILELEC